MTPANSRPSPGEQASRLRVTKKLAPTSRGAIKLAQEFGEALICVRHRTDLSAKVRYTTVELLVDKTPIQPRQAQLVNIRVNPKEYGLRTVVRAAGGIWDPSLGLWRLPKRVATVLRLTQRIVSPK